MATLSPESSASIMTTRRLRASHANGRRLRGSAAADRLSPESALHTRSVLSAAAARMRPSGNASAKGRAPDPCRVRTRRES